MKMPAQSVIARNAEIAAIDRAAIELMRLNDEPWPGPTFHKRWIEAYELARAKIRA